MDHVIVERFFEFKQIVKLFERGSDSALPTAKLTLARWEIEDDECWSEDDPEADDHEIYEAARYY